MIIMLFKYFLEMFNCQNMPFASGLYLKADLDKTFSPFSRSI